MSHTQQPKRQRRRTQADHLDHLQHLNKQLAAYERSLRHSVMVARNHGASWQDIANRMGISRQAAWERFGKEP